MKKSLVVLGTLSILLTSCAISNPVVNVANGIISTFSEVEKEFMPDYANISISVETTDKNSLKASEENKTTTKKIISALNTKLNTSNGDKLSTINFVVYPNYSNNGRNIVSYTCRNTILVKLKDLEKTGAIIDLAINNGAAKINNVTFDVENEQNMCNELLPEAINNTKIRAGIIAKGLNLQINGVSKVNSNCYVQNSSNYATYANAKLARTMSMGASADSEESSSNSTPIEPKSIKVRASVNVDYKIK
ncbi:MAG: hypothetical protein BHW64_05270 [Candidatus Melainabacteria bacterium LEY3_CP_29_8]|nr:MAG: hypothetical protein BHW64_05270 [Candidatus Melainabacteria bacterium LEY3_CP_29_8]